MCLNAEPYLTRDWQIPGDIFQDIVAVGVTNQRESTVVWDRSTGKPLHNAILWLDVRTSGTVDELTELLPEKNRNYYQPLTGLPLSTYFSGVKLRWLKDNVPDVAKSIENNECMFGTIDTWLLWNLTGGTSGGVHITDVTNASRTMLMSIETCQWAPEMLEFFEVPLSILPEIRSSSEVYGVFAKGPLEVRAEYMCPSHNFAVESILLFFHRLVRYLGASAINKRLWWVSSVLKKARRKQPTEPVAFCCTTRARNALLRRMGSYRRWHINLDRMHHLNMLSKAQ